MAIPPFPSQDLAKLVLGYLAEEQLMTAYDEFLQASPYLDALRNEYDRIFMTSLRNILAEYRAVKIYVESCKPITLRKKIFQCSNMLEVVKVLISLIDLNKLNGQDFIIDKVSSYKPSVSQKPFECDGCNSSDSVSCDCKGKTPITESIITQTTSEIEAATLETSIETTSLSDLPGNTITDEIPAKENIPLNVISPQLSTIELEEKQSHELNTLNEQPCLPATDCLNGTFDQRSTSPQIVSLGQSNEIKHNTPETSTSNVCIPENNSNVAVKRKRKPRSTLTKHLSKPNDVSFQDFSAGVKGNESNIINASDPNKKHQISPPICLPKTCTNNDSSTISKGVTKYRKILPLCSKLSTTPNANNTRSEDKTDQKITIISDVKVNDTHSNINNSKMPSILNTATSTPLLPTHKITINGTPAYKNKTMNTAPFSYTKDEIMAMPTIILMPVSGPAQKSSLTRQRTLKKRPDSVVKTSTSARTLGPLIIDVVSSSVQIQDSPKPKELPALENHKNRESELLRTIDLTTHASLPKDAAIANLDKLSTPNVIPPARKSSSTPRRSSHVRVLDFTTPRRILNVSNNDVNTNKNNPSDTVIKAPEPSLTTVLESIELDNDENDNTSYLQSISECNLSIENKSQPKNKFNWDRDLRALAVKNDDGTETNTNKNTPKNTPKIKPRISSQRKKQTPCNVVASNNKIESPLNLKNSNLNTAKKMKKNLKSIEIVDDSKDKDTKDINTEPVIPTINVIAGNDWSEPLSQEKGNKDKIGDDTEQNDTPEMDKISLQYVIGAKLNISDLLETPYKQVLYDIQMETPRFLGSGLPDEPMSDIKIMNIPTPRFFGTPKPTQATPSSYSSRPTDYSSGGSYYKPDDQDYMPLAEVFECAGAVGDKSTKNVIVDQNSPIEAEQSSSTKIVKPSRPVRKCAKNVSYRTPSSKVKEDNKSDVTYASSEESMCEKKINAAKVSKSILKNKLTVRRKSENDNKSSIKRKSNVKKVTPKKFMKINPRKISPIKYTISTKGKKKTPDFKHTMPSPVQSRKRTNSKEKIISNGLTIAAAAPTKSRRKSATPRKLQCTKSFNESSDNNSSEKTKSDLEVTTSSKDFYIQDSDTEQLPLRWSDDCSQDSRAKCNKANSSQNEDDDISKIKEYIATSVSPSTNIEKNGDGSLHNDLVRRGFDIETAKIIERDLLDTPPRTIQNTSVEFTTEKPNLGEESKTDLENRQVNDVTDDETEIDDVELSVSECCENSKNYVSYCFEDTMFTPNDDLPKLKEKFSMELCMDDGVSIRLRATCLELLFEQDPEENYNPKETESAVCSISNYDKLYTPIKDLRAQCYEIFDSTLTSLDTPLKVNSPIEKEYQNTITEIVLEVENLEVRDKMETRKRKKVSGVLEESISASKKSKSDSQYMLSSANIQNMDIESVLSKLHGP